MGAQLTLTGVYPKKRATPAFFKPTAILGVNPYGS